jgi:hypothetical protein
MKFWNSAVENVLFMTKRKKYAKETVCTRLKLTDALNLLSSKF